MVQRGNATFRSGELAKATGVSADTIRHYEKIGVLPKAVRSTSGYRLYPQGAVERVLVVQRALRIGFTLSELSEVLKARDAGSAPCERVFELAQQKLMGIKTDIAALKQTERGASLFTTHLSSDREAAWPERGIQVKNAGFTLLRCTERWIIVPYQ